MKKKKSIYEKFDEKLYPLKVFIMSWIEPECWVIDKSAKTILDVGCGEGLPMEMIKMRINVEKSVGVDLFEPYIRKSKKKRIHNEYVLVDVRKMKFPNKSFDVVMALQVLEHLPKKDAWKVLEKMEKIAKKQVIAAMPIGEMYHPAVDNNELQLHQSHFDPEEFKKKGYKVTKVGFKFITGEHGLVHKVKNDVLRKFIYSLNLFITLFTILFPKVGDYYFVAYKSFYINSR